MASNSGDKPLVCPVFLVLVEFPFASCSLADVGGASCSTLRDPDDFGPIDVERERFKVVLSDDNDVEREERFKPIDDALEFFSTNSSAF